MEASRSQDNIYNNCDFSSDTLAESLARWESAFSECAYCHPFVAYDGENVDGTKYLPSDDDAGGANANYWPVIATSRKGQQQLQQE
jgi:hypothetical protein